MNRSLTLVAYLLAVIGAAGAHGAGQNPWAQDFKIPKSELASKGRNPFLILEPGYRLALAGGKTHLVVTVLDETKTVDGVEMRVVEERETENGNLVEVSRNFFSISKRDQAVYYFGEEVDIYRNGKVVGHEGAWRSGKNGAKYGMMIPGKPAVGMRYYQELAPKVAMDRAEIVSVAASQKTPAGAFSRCLKVEETTPLEPGAKEYKVYAPGVGLVRDGKLRLVKYGKEP